MQRYLQRYFSSGASTLGRCWRAQHVSPGVHPLGSKAFSTSSWARHTVQPSRTLWGRFAPRPALKAAQDAQQLAARYTPTPVQQLFSAAASGTFFRTLGIQAQAFSMKAGTIVVTLAFAGLTYGTWTVLQTVASLAEDVRTTRTTWLILGGTAVITGTAVAVFRQQWVINPRQVYDLAMLQLSRDPAAVNVLGLPMVGSEMRACLQTGGGFRFKWGIPVRRSQRLHMIFPVTGRERGGVVSLEAKKRWGKYEFKALCVDVPSDAPLGEEARIVIAGATSRASAAHGAAHSRGGSGSATESAWTSPPASASASTAGADPRASTTAAATAQDDVYSDAELQGLRHVRSAIAPALRAPLANALQLRDAYDAEDDADDRAARAAAAAVARAAERRRAEQQPKALDAGGGMYLYERLYWNVYYVGKGVRDVVSRWQTRHLST